MRIELKLFYTLRRYAPAGPEPISVEMADGGTLAQLIELLAIPAKLKYVTLINGRPGRPDSRLSDGDMVIMFPPVEGG